MAQDTGNEQTMIRVPRHVARFFRIVAAEHGVTTGFVASAAVEDERRVRLAVKGAIARAADAKAKA